MNETGIDNHLQWFNMYVDNSTISREKSILSLLEHNIICSFASELNVQLIILINSIRLRDLFHWFKSQ